MIDILLMASIAIGVFTASVAVGKREAATGNSENTFAVVSAAVLACVVVIPLMVVGTVITLVKRNI